MCARSAPRNWPSTKRIFERSYRQALNPPATLAALGVSSRSGPMVERTDALMSLHYDERAEFFDAILDTHYRAYSMAYYGATADEARASGASLEAAQRAKFDLFVERAGLRGGERVFNIGCGFGSLETYLLETFPDITVTGVTPSRVQLAYLRGRMQNPADVLGHGRFRLLEGGFNTLPVEQMGTGYDLLFSVGVLEHFTNLEATFARQAAMLRPGGRAFHHLIVSRYPIPGFADQRDTRLRAYFPGGRLWPFAELERHTEHLALEASWYLNGLNYWRTLQDWHRRYWNHADALYPAVFDLAAFRHWNEYFSISKVMFAPGEGGIVGNGHFLYRKA